MAWLADSLVERASCTCCGGQKCAACRAWRPGRCSRAIDRGDVDARPRPQPSPLVALVAEALAAAPDGLTLRELRSQFARGETAIRDTLRLLRDDGRAHSRRRGHRTRWLTGPAPEGAPVPPKAPRAWEQSLSPARAAAVEQLRLAQHARGQHRRAYLRADVIQLGILYYHERGSWPNTRRLREDYALPTIDTVCQLFGSLAGYIAACQEAMVMDTSEEMVG